MHNYVCSSCNSRQLYIQRMSPALIVQRPVSLRMGVTRFTQVEVRITGVRNIRQRARRVTTQGVYSAASWPG